MCIWRFRRILGACHKERHRDPKDRTPKHSRQRGDTPMMTLKLTTRYARYLLTSLATVAFGVPLN